MGTAAGTLPYLFGRRLKACVTGNWKADPMRTAEETIEKTFLVQDVAQADGSDVPICTFPNWRRDSSLYRAICASAELRKQGKRSPHFLADLWTMTNFKANPSSSSLPDRPRDRAGFLTHHCLECDNLTRCTACLQGFQKAHMTCRGHGGH